jgi:hypothetical protein
MAGRNSIIKAIITADTAGFEKSMASLDKRMQSSGRRMTAGLTLPLAAAGIAAFKMASDLDESTSQAETVFGDAADAMIRDAQNLTDSFSESEYLAFAGNIGDIAQGMGFARAASAELSTSVLSLGQDLGSFKNLPTEQAVNAITSAMTGEREALKSLGIVVNEAMVKQEALALGLGDVNRELTQQEKAQATLSLITAASTNAIGDFDRTSDGAANKARILTANFKDTAAELGQNLLPLGEQLMTWANDLVGMFGDLSPATQKVALAVAGVAAAAGPLLSVGGNVLSLFRKLKVASVLNATAFSGFGIGLAAVAGAMFLVSKKANTSGLSTRVMSSEMAAAVDIGDTLTGTFDRLTGSMDEYGIAAVTATLDSLGLSESFIDAGVTGTDLIDRLMEIGDTSNVADQLAAWEQLRDELGFSEQQLGDNQSALFRLAGTMFDAKGRTERLAQTTGILADETNEVAGAADTAELKWRELTETLLGGIDVTAKTNLLLEAVTGTLGELDELTLGQIQSEVFDTASQLSAIFDAASPEDVAAMQGKFDSIVTGILGIGDQAQLSESQISALLETVAVFSNLPVVDFGPTGDDLHREANRGTGGYGGLSSADWEAIGGLTTNVTVELDGVAIGSAVANSNSDRGHG